MACAACSTIPPVQADGYESKGTFETIGGLKTYVTGSATATKAIIDVYDIFGYHSNTQQGADGLAKATGFLVLIPDLLKGRFAQGEWFSPTATKEQADAKADFIGNFAFDFATHSKTFDDFLEAAKTEFADVSSWGALGLCWGGKITALASVEGTTLKATGQVHPGGFNSADAKNITIPHICLPSKDEDQNTVNEYKTILSGLSKDHVVELYPTMHHGWMGARSRLNEEDNFNEFSRGYNQVAAFFVKHM